MTELTRIADLWEMLLDIDINILVLYCCIYQLTCQYQHTKNHANLQVIEKKCQILKLWFLISVLISSSSKIQNSLSVLISNSKIQNSLRQRMHYKWGSILHCIKQSIDQVITLHKIILTNMLHLIWDNLGQAAVAILFSIPEIDFLDVEIKAHGKNVVI